MKYPWLHRSAVLVAIVSLIVIALGALLTSETRTLPGATVTSAVSAPSLEQVHLIAGFVVAFLMIVVAGWTLRSNLIRSMAGITGIIEIVSGRAPIVHALFAPLFFSFAVAIAVLTSKSWEAGPKHVDCSWKPLRPLGIAIPVLVLLQIGLGTAFRHNAMGVVWHILDALIVLAAAMVAGVCVFRQYEEHHSLRPAALALLIIVGVQVLLGFSVYLTLLMSSENSIGLIVTGVLHVTNGALTLAASVVLAMQMQRNLIQLSGA
jgi:hypothetical protein